MGKPKDIQFPAGGVARRVSERTSSGRRGPYPSPWALNTRLEDALTTRLRGGSFTAQAPTRTCTALSYLLTEDGDYVLTEDGDFIVIDNGVAPTYVTLVTENGDTIVTENGDTIVLGPQHTATVDDGTEEIAGGQDAPEASLADCLYRGRLLRAVDNAIFCSRQGDTSDWDYGKDANDTGRATVFQLSEAGAVGDDVIALCPYKDASLICWSATETWVLTGDPVTGSLRRVSGEAGIVGAFAWCRAHGTVYFLSEHGLYSVNADGSQFKPISEEVIPEHLKGVDDTCPVLDYYHPDRGVYIHLEDYTSWYYDIAREQFWPFDRTSSNSHVLVGPFKLGNISEFGQLLNLHGNMATGSADVTWRIVTGDTAEDAAANGKAAITAYEAGSSYSTYVHSSGTWSAGRAHMAYPRTRAIWCCIWLSSAGTWAYEAARITTKQAGKWR